MGILDRLGMQNPFAAVGDNLRAATGQIIEAPFPERPAPPTPEAIKSLDELIASLFPEQVQNPMNLEQGQTTPDITSPEAAMAEQGIDASNPLAAGVAKLKRGERAAPKVEAAPAGAVERRSLPNVQPRRPDAGGDMAVYRQAIKDIESSGGNYQIVGKPHPKYGRPLGAYQVMESNLPSWSREVLGRVVSPEEFLATPKIQDQIFDTKFGQSIRKYGSPEDAASVWFTGRPAGNKKAQTDTDSLGTSGSKYVAMFRNGVAKYSGGKGLPADRSGSEGQEPTALAGLELNRVNQPPQGDPTRPPPKQHVMGESFVPGAEESSIEVPDQNVRRRQMIADAIKQTRNTASLKGLPRTEIVSILQEMGRGVAGVPRVSRQREKA